MPPPCARAKARSSRSSSKTDAPEHLVVGRLGRPVGLKGEIELLVVSDDPHRFDPYSLVFTSDGRRLTVRRSRRQGERTIVSFSEVTDRTTAESLRGRELFIATEQARDLQSGEYWDHDLIGCTVMTTTDTVVGTVTDVLHQPANEVLVVSRDGEEVLIPLVEAVVKEVEPRKRITIRPDYGG